MVLGIWAKSKGLRRAVNEGAVVAEWVEETYQAQKGEFLVGIDESELVAIGAFKRISEKSAELKRMSIHPNYRRKGCGQLTLASL